LDAIHKAYKKRVGDAWPPCPWDADIKLFAG
jgi:hypothetical protein